MQTLTNQRIRWNKVIVYFLFLAFYYWMVAQIPYTHDDWDWGLDVGIQQWLHASINSRYMGNFCEIIMTRSEIIKTLLMGSCFFLIPYLLSYLATQNDNSNHRLVLFLAANFVLLTMDRRIWCETYGWVAGFANFGISSVFMLLCFIQWSPLLMEDFSEQKRSVMHAVLYFFISVFCQLFIENLSIFMAVVSVFACIISYRKSKCIPLHYILMAIGFAVGLLIMFSSSMYSTLFATGEAIGGYRKVFLPANNSIQEIIVGLVMQCGRLVFRVNEMNSLLCVLILQLLNYKTILNRKSLRNNIAIGFACINIVLTAYHACVLFGKIDLSYDNLAVAAGAALTSVIYLLTVVVEVLVLYKKAHALKRKLLLLWVMPMCVLAPLVVTSESGARLMLTPSIIYTLFSITIISDIISNYPGDATQKAEGVCFAAVSVPVIMCIAVYMAIGSCKAQREEIISQASVSGEPIVVLPQYPYDEYLHYPDPNEDWRWECFKDFYGIADEVEIIIKDVE